MPGASPVLRRSGTRLPPTIDNRPTERNFPRKAISTPIKTENAMTKKATCGGYSP